MARTMQYPLFRRSVSVWVTRVSVGNISGVGMDFIMGGTGAIFCIWIFTLLGAATNFVECTIGQIYKEKGADGLFH